MESWHDRWLLPTLERLLGALEGLDRCDLYMALCARFPAHTIGAALGISEDETAVVHDWIIRTATNMPKEESESAAAKLVEFLQPIIEDRRSSPGEDVISLLVTSELQRRGRLHAPLERRRSHGFLWSAPHCRNGYHLQSNRDPDAQCPVATRGSSSK